MMQNGNAQNVTEPDFWKKIHFWPKMPEICRKNRFFGIFSKFRHWFFLIFCTKMHISVFPKTWLSPICEKNSFPAENAGNDRFCIFSSDFFLISRCFFTLKHFRQKNVDFLSVCMFIWLRKARLAFVPKSAACLYKANKSLVKCSEPFFIGRSSSLWDWLGWSSYQWPIWSYC